MGARFLTARIAGIAGIVFVVATAVPGFAAGSPPDPGDPASKFLSYASSNRSALIVAQALAMVGTFFGIFFFAKLISAMRRIGGAGNPLTLAGMISIAVVATLASVGGVLQVVAAFRLNAGEHLDAITVQALSDASALSFAFIGMPFAAFFVSQGLLVRASRAPGWLGIMWLVAGALEAVASFTILSSTGFFSPEGAAGLFLGLLPFGLTVLATSITMLVRPGAFDDEEEAVARTMAAPAPAGAGAG